MKLPTPKLVDRFEKISKIGEGSYGTVYKVRERRSRDILALKRVKLGKSGHGANEGIPSSSLREIAALKDLKHPNVLELYDIVHTGTSLYLVLEYLDLDLKKTLDATQSGLSEKLAKSYLTQLLKAIAYCHSQRVLHRDLKLQNLLVSKHGIIKLADFGLSRTMSMPLRKCTREVVTLWYRAPEILLGSELYGPAVDIWSLGCIFFEMLTKRVLFPGSSEIDQLFKIFQVLGTPTRNDWPESIKLPYFKTLFPVWTKKSMRVLLDSKSNAADLLERMLLYDPFQRCTALQALQHPCLDDISKRPTLKSIQDQIQT